MYPCANCGTSNPPGTSYCGTCGAPLAAMPAPAGGPPPSQNPWMWVAIVALVAVILVGGLAVFLAASGGDDETDTADSTIPPATASTAPASSTTTAPSSTTTSATTVPPTSPPATGLGDVLNQPSGLYCRDLYAMGYSYSAAVDYWRREGNTNRMDADRNGIPCETVYARSDVVAYWGDIGWGDPTFDYLDTIPSGLFCRDLADAGFTYSEAVAYWYWDGLPDSMDEDLDGIPCETVYGEDVAAAYWGFD